MVKNIKGGNKAKKGGRKFLEPETSINIRYKKEDDEIYCVVTKLLGGGLCEVRCDDNKIRLCVIRGKFKGKKKRNNLINIGNLVLAGKREWELSTSNTRSKCDLLYIYSDTEKYKVINSLDDANVKTILQTEDINDIFTNYDDNNTLNDDNNTLNDNNNTENDNNNTVNNNNAFNFDFDNI
jgi:initiation factor 1A